jgi:Cu-Zn family superoxide dismutase
VIYLFSACQLSGLLNKQPSARAKISGSVYYPEISGWVIFYQVKGGVILIAEINGLPHGGDLCPASVFGFHIHEGSHCSGTADDPFADTGAHYNPHHCPHPEHAGDLPPLFGNQGYAFMALFTSRFSVDEIIGRTVIIHSSPDDFTTQPSGNSGEKIACGHILSTY